MYNNNFWKASSTQNQDTDYSNQQPPIKKLRNSIINSYSPELLKIIHTNKSVFKNQQYEQIEFIPFIQERDGCGRIISSSTRSSSLKNVHQNQSIAIHHSVKKMPTLNSNSVITKFSPQTRGSLFELVSLRSSRPQTTQTCKEKYIQLFQPQREYSDDKLNFDQFKANMPFHAILNNNEQQIMKVSKISEQKEKKNQNFTHSACFKSKSRDPIYSSNIEHPAIGQYDISTKSTYAKITRNIFMPQSSFKQINPKGPDSLDYVNLLEIFKKQHEIDKISNDFSKQTHRDLFATLLNQKKEKVLNQDQRILQLEPEELKREFRHQSEMEDLVYQKFKRMYSPYVMKIKKQQQPIGGLKFKDAQKKIQLTDFLQLIFISSNNYKITQRIKKKAAKLEY